MSRFLLCIAALLTLATILKAAKDPVASARRATFRNPLKGNGADPWMTYDDGWYYLCTTTDSDVQMRRARHLGELRDAPDQVVWKDAMPSRARNIWAAEFHRLQGDHGVRWFLYYTASDGRDDNHHRLHVAESAGSDPRGPYTYRAQLLTDPQDEFYAIDGTVLKLPNGELYFLWCGRPSPAGQGLYISRMANPWTLIGPRRYLPASGFGCSVVREGPETLQHNGKVYLIYSMCGADTPDYKLGMLMADAHGDLLNPASWIQYPTPVLKRVDARGVYGPGHNFFFKSPDGKEDWIIYHAKSGVANTFGDRSARAQRFTWNADGTPNFGAPLSLDTEIPVPSGEVAAR